MDYELDRTGYTAPATFLMIMFLPVISSSSSTQPQTDYKERLLPYSLRNHLSLNLSLTSLFQPLSRFPPSLSVVFAIIIG